MRSTLKELWTRVIETSAKEEIYINGSDNDYAERIERVINNSVTAKSAANKMVDFILGKGVDSPDYKDETIVNPAKGLSLYDIANMAAKSIAYHRGFYLHVNYDAAGDVNYLDVLPYSNCRIAKEDDRGYSGLIWYSKSWNETGSKFGRKKKNKDKRYFYPYNPKIEVINEQRKKDSQGEKDIAKVLSRYRGQVLFVNLEPESIYPLAYVDAVYNDADSEYRSSLFKNTSLRNGFIGKVVANMVGADTEEDTRANENNLQQLVGAENTAGLLVFRTELGDDGLPIKAVTFDSIDSNVDDKMFEYTERSVMNNILMAFNNIPKALVLSGDGALFGTSGDSLREMKEYYQNETDTERRKLSMALSKVLKSDINFKLLIQPKADTDGSITD